MALPVVTAGVRLAMAIATRAGKKLVKTSTSGGTGKYKYATAKKSFYKASKLTIKKTIRGIKPAVIGTKRHLKFYSKVIAPSVTAPDKFATARGLKHLIARPTFGQRQLLNVRAGSKFAGTYVDKTTKGMKLRAKLLKGGLYGGYAYGASKLRS